MLDLLIFNVRIATLAVGLPQLGIIEADAIGVSGDRIAFVGKRSDAPPASQTLDAKRRWVTPGFIDCHTHLVYGGDRAHEFELRLAGATYPEIAAAGGGILSTVKATRAVSERNLTLAAARRLDCLIREGVTTIEIKSGYGLDRETELKMLRVARSLEKRRKISVQTTYLGAHAFPPDIARDDYLDLVCNEMIPLVSREGLADAVDAFCEGLALSVDETRRVFEAARANRLPVKLHAEQLSHLGGTSLAASFHALSCDHVEYANEDDAIAMAKSGSVAVLLPGAFHMLREKQQPPVEAFRRHGVPMAVSTDANPGSSPMTSLLLAMNMACVIFRLTVPEAIAGVTREAARALGQLDEIGTIETGKRADLALWSVDRLAELPYRMGANPLWKRIFAGKIS